MCGPFKSPQAILRLVEMILSALALAVVVFRGKMVNPWGIWCEFVWVFCFVVPTVLTVVEAKSWHILLAAFLPGWDDLCCGLTVMCALVVLSATVAFAAVFVCATCISSILCALFSLAATAVFLVDAVKQRMKRPSGYLTSLRGILRFTEAFLACLILTAAASHFLGVDWASRPIGMMVAVAVFALCLLGTVAIILLHLLSLLRCLLSFGLGLMELVFNVMAVLSYICAVVLWAFYGYRRRCISCSVKDLNTVTVGSIVNLILYNVDLVLSVKAR
ncbi:myeloid-associated differentiation marker-like protein 2 [Lampris incognitus]|uniref:myeloid-associated differentiation marker-like protein 2 n=1 Tax=Lampris incognitus TaxID=2546036 RepID=UPI0024B58028|nr:myeloid-associated differentiation marker-like protein 2 [Lampris incognitus]